MKTNKLLLSFCVVFFLLWVCGFGPQPLIAQTLTGAITEVDRYGNVSTDISAEALTKAGFELGDVLRLEVGTFNGELPLVTTYADVQRGDPLVRVNNGTLALAISYGNFAQTNGATDGLPVTITMVSKGAYKAELEIRNLTRTNNRSDYSSDAVFANFREVRMGGIPANVLFRSSHPALDDARAPYAATLGEQARIAAVINLADTAQELSERAVPWYQSFVARGNIIALGMGVDYKSQDFAVKLKTGLEFMLNHSAPFLIHCNEGKDRAGVTVALLEALMGASPNDIVDDYMISYANYYGVAKGEERYGLIATIMQDILKDFNGGTAPKEGETTAAAERYLSTVVGFTPVQISALKVKLSGR
jgi:protein tyrosine/serine phosphatase